MTTRARRRRSKVHRLTLLTHWQRWCLTYGNIGGSAFDSEAEWHEAYRLHRGALLAELDDPAESFRAFWLYDDAVPDELREDLRPAGHALLPPAQAADYQQRYADLMQRR